MILKSLLFLVLLVAGIQAQDKPCLNLDVKYKTPSGVQFIWGERAKYWRQRSAVTVFFTDGTERQKAAAWKRFQVIDKLVNLTFKKSTTTPANIRVGFNQSGHWSYIGTDCLLISQNKQTMNIGLSAAAIGGDFEGEWDRVALHEICHAIGMGHEHQHPTSTGLIWNKPTVYEYYKRLGWSKTVVDRQVFDRYKSSTWNGTEFDMKSIMLYAIPEGHANIVVGWNTSLSATDILFLKRQYPNL